MNIKLRVLNGTSYLKISKKLIEKFDIDGYVNLDPETLVITPIYDHIEILGEVGKILNNEKLFTKENGLVLAQNIITCFRSFKYWSENEKFIIEVLKDKYDLYYSKEFKQWYIQGYSYAKGYEHAKKESVIVK